MRDEPEVLTPELMLRAYAHGIFPMAERRDDDTVFWVDPERRGILPLDGFHASRSLARSMRRQAPLLTTNRCFARVVAACADREETWISHGLFDLYMRLRAMGHAHSVEIWFGDALAGGVFGIALGGAFFGESMFSARTDGSKLALWGLVTLLREAGFVLFDTQFLTPHLASLGGVEISRAAYLARLEAALGIKAEFPLQPSEGVALSSLVQRSTHTS